MCLLLQGLGPDLLGLAALDAVNQSVRPELVSVAWKECFLPLENHTGGEEAKWVVGQMLSRRATWETSHFWIQTSSDVMQKARKGRGRNRPRSPREGGHTPVQGGLSQGHAGTVTLEDSRPGESWMWQQRGRMLDPLTE